MEPVRLNCSNIKNGSENVIENMGFKVRVFHKSDDDACVKRVSIEHKDMTAELLPSKGLTLNEAFYKGQPFFWEPPIKALSNPNEFDPFEKMYIDGKLTEGFSWLRQFTGGVEMLGLENWGMPRNDSETHTLMPMHGTASLIPVNSIEVIINIDSAEISGKFEVRKTIEQTSQIPWYERGELLFEVTKRIFIKPASARIILQDTITNISAKSRKAQWGYHVQMRAVEGAEYLIPSKVLKRIGDSKAQNNHEIWYNSKEENVREQTMNKHENLEVVDNIIGNKSSVRTLLKYPDGHAVMALIPACPWIASWMSAGGKDGDEWCLADSEGKKAGSIMNENYNGIGPEFGASDLFTGEVEATKRYEPKYDEPPLKPGESTDIFTIFEMLKPAQACIFEDEIKNFVAGRKFE